MNSSLQNAFKVSLCLAILLLAFFWSIPGRSETIQGGISHAEYMPPLSAGGNQQSSYQQSSYPSQLLSSSATRYGQQYYQPKLQKYVEWFQIPNWMAGTWSKQGDLTVSATDLNTGYRSNQQSWVDNRMVVTFGHQMDRQGGIWQANVLPAETDSMSGSKMVRFMAVSRRLEASDQSGLVTRTHYVITESSAGTGQIADQFQQESLNHYGILQDGELINRSSNRVFSYAGRPMRDGNLESRFNRVAAFSPRTELDGFDLAASFKQYLNSIGRGDLAP
ncbi:MAG: hypothetical protein K2Y32_03950 [Candidatus Obscuribacterales bacterium]|nr:hypothetical protein [Candidatus Obscuribacterales bacterium]